MVNESEPDRRPGLEQPSGGSLAVNGVSVLPSAESLPIRGAVEADGSSYTAGEVNGDDRVNVRRKRGRPPKGGRVAKAVAAPVAKRIKKEEEDVCFICFDGGSLVLCDRRDCPKAYHPACVKRDEAFFTPRLRWNCGWHLCNTCQRNALFMCYTCPYSLCKTCVKQADISCVRGNKGFCKTCMSTISLIENIKQGNNQVGHVDFDDTTSWEYLFKVYWVYLKQKESLTLDELTRATNPWKGHMLNHVNNHVELSRTTAPLETNNNQVETNICRRRKTRKQLPMQNNSFERIVTYKLQENDVEWASKELLEFVAFVKNGDTSKLTQFDVRALLLEYIRKNKLRDPRRKCQIICDKRLEVLFGKARLAHFEMLKLLEYHFKDGSCASSVVRAAAIDSPSSEMKFEERSEESNIFARERKRHARKKVDERERHIKFDNYAAINVHNMSLIYLRRSLMENLLEDLEKFHDKVVGAIVRIRIVDNDLKQEMYRLVQVVDTGKAAEPYKIGDKTAHVILKILNLDKIEDVRIDAISNQDLSEDECIRLQQNITCGLVERMTVGEVHKKAIALQEVRIKDVIETEILKLNHLRDRASELGHRKELRECVEKLELLKSPEERLRRMHEIPEVHADPRMDSMYQSDEDSEQSATKQDVSMTPIHSISNSSVEPIARSSSSNWDLKRNVSDRPQINKEDDAARSLESSQSTLELEKDAARILEELRNQVDPCRITSKHEVRTLVNHPRDASDASVTSSSRSVPRYSTEHEKIWHYRDPSGKAQGPFCMQLLRKWNSDGYFPADLRIWRMNESQDKSLLLTDALLNQCNEDQFQSECLDPPEARFVSGCRSPEHGGQLSININAAWTNEKPHDGCVSDLIDAGKCSDDKGQPITGPNSRQGADQDYSSQVSPVANHNSSHVVSCPGGEVSNASLAVRDTVSRTVDQNHKSSPVASGEVSNACLAMRDTVIQTMDQDHKSDLVASSPGEEEPIACLASTDTVFQTVEQNYEPDCSNLPSLMPNGGSEDPKCLDTEAGQKVSASNVSSHMSGSSLGLSCGGLEFPNPSISTIKREPDHATLKEQEENKTAGDVRCEAEEHNQPVPSIVLEQNLGSDRKTTNFSDLPSQKLELNEGTKSDVVEFKEPVASYMQGQDSFTNWHALSSGIGFSVPVSSANQNSEGLKGLATELSLSSNATCHDIGFSWSSAAPLAGVTGPWPSRSMPTKSSVVELDSDIKFSDDATTTTGSCQFTHSLTTLLDCNTSIWHDGPIELSTLGDESVSDLLSEVEAMESLHGLPSPNSGIDFGDDPIGSLGNDCFSPLVGLSLPLMAGKHDTWSSTCDIQFRPQPTITDSQPSHSLHLHECPTNPLREDVRVKQELASSTQQDFLSLTCTPLATNPVCFGISLPMHHSPPGVDSHGHHHPPTSLSLSTMDPCRGPKPEKLHDDISNSNSLNLGFVSLHHSPEPSLTPPAIPNTSSQMGVAAAAPSQQQIFHPDVTASSPAEEGEVEAAAPAAAAASLSLQLSVNVPAAPPHHSPKDPARRKISGFGEEGKPSSRATGCGNRASQHPRLHGAGGGRRYHQNIDPGPGFLKPARPPWSRQSSFNSSAGGYSRQPHRGQRVCKFYESGYCKKGASCNYLHP